MEKITSRRNSKCAHAKNLGKSREYREKHGEFLCDGQKLLDEAINSKSKIESVFVTSELQTPLAESTNVFVIDKNVYDNISPLKSPQDVLFICKIPEYDAIDYKKGTHILLDNVQDPGNVGTIIRSAYAFGIDSVILTENSADPFNPKSVRASMGAVFRQKISILSIEHICDIKARFVAAENSKDSISVNIVGQKIEKDLKNKIIMLGNESKGISKKLQVLCEETITIPLLPHCESLNVAIAASIIMWEDSNNKCFLRKR